MNSICHKPQTANTNKAVLAPHGSCLALSEEPASGGSRHRVDEFVRSAVGAQGMLDIARAGGLTIAQDEESSVVFGMPRCAIELGAARQVLPLDQIGPALCALAAGVNRL